MRDFILARIRRLTRRPQTSPSAELSETEMAEVIDRQTLDLLEMSRESFVAALKTGALDRSDWRVEYLAGLVE